MFSFGKNHLSPSSRRMINQGYNDSLQGERVADNLQENLPANEIQDLLTQARRNTNNQLQIAKNLYQFDREKFGCWNVSWKLEGLFCSMVCLLLE